MFFHSKKTKTKNNITLGNMKMIFMGSSLLQSPVHSFGNLLASTLADAQQLGENKNTEEMFN